MLPLFIVSILLGTLLARKLLAHQRLIELLSREVQEYRSKDIVENAHVLGRAVKLQGRTAFIQSLRDFGRKGWTTTAIVGRRGVGKTRVLYELLYQHDNNHIKNNGASTIRSPPSSTKVNSWQRCLSA